MKKDAGSNLISVIKYEGPNDVFVWKHPIEDFNMGSQLIVHESQEAIFFKDGKALDLFGSGRYTLSTNNIPILNGIYKLPTGGESPFHAEVYYVNLVTQLGVKWGTDSKIRMFDPISGLHIEIGASGQFNIRVNDARKLLVKLVGTTTKLSQGDLFGSDYSTQSMMGKFKALIVTKVKSFLAKTIRENNINILEVDEYVDDISSNLKDLINNVLADYGLTMPEFFVTTIATPDDEPNFRRLKQQYAERYLRVQQERILQAEAEAAQQRKVVEAQTAAQEELIAAQASAQAYKFKAEAEATEMKMKGYTYQQETAREVAKAAVSNTGSGVGGEVSGTISGMVNLGIGLGVMGEVVKTVKDSVAPAMNNAAAPVVNNTNEQQPAQPTKVDVTSDVWECPTCHNKATTPFCPNCGTKKENK